MILHIFILLTTEIENLHKNNWDSIVSLNPFKFQVAS